MHQHIGCECLVNMGRRDSACRVGMHYQAATELARNRSMGIKHGTPCPYNPGEIGIDSRCVDKHICAYGMPCPCFEKNPYAERMYGIKPCGGTL